MVETDIKQYKKIACKNHFHRSSLIMYGPLTRINEEAIFNATLGSICFFKYF